MAILKIEEIEAEFINGKVVNITQPHTIELNEELQMFIIEKGNNTFYLPFENTTSLVVERSPGRP